MSSIEQKTVNAIRILAADAIQKANSGHPGLPLGAAPMAYELWARHMKFNPKDAKWINRDRFILSAGHGSAMLYALNHLFGCGLSIEDIKNFRQLGSKTPGHPEYPLTPAVEATTGPLGAGLAMAVGMAIAQAHLAKIFNKPNYPIFDNYTFVLAGDGCFMEGLSSEAFSLAGTLGLDKLIVLYDRNKITIEGDTDLTFCEDVEKRMEAFGFQTLTVEDGNDLEEIGKAIEKAKSEKTKPSFITIKTQIGFGCPAKQGKACAHGEPLGVDNIEDLRKTLNWSCKEPFCVDKDVYKHCESLTKNNILKYEKWNKMFLEYCEKYPEMKALWNKYNQDLDPEILLNDKDFWTFENKPAATRSSSGEIINKLTKYLPNLIGGSADLGPSNKTEMKGLGYFSKMTPEGTNMHFGVREQAMAGIANGIALYGGMKSFVATFFVFSDYLKPMARLSALMHLPVTYIFTHDSIGVGEDGPTHQPVEQLAMLRSTPNFIVFRPADAIETAAGWFCAATSKNTPVALVLTRQNIPQIDTNIERKEQALKGAYIISKESKSEPDAIIIATGSEVELALAAKDKLKDENIDVRVVSMPSMEIFEKQSSDYKESILPQKIRKRVAIEALSSFGWERYTGLDGKTLTINSFGASAPAKQLFEKFGYTVENVIKTVKSVL